MWLSQYFQPRTGQPGDVVFYKRSFGYWWLPNKAFIGWRPYANAASAKNKHEVKMNKLADEFMDELYAWAQATKDLQGDAANMRKEYEIDMYGIGKPTYLTVKDVKAMLPYTPSPTPEWKSFIQPSVITKVLVAAKVDVGKAMGNKDKSDLVVTNAKGKDLVDQGKAHSFVEFKSGDKNSQGNNSGNKSKGKWKQLKGQFPQKDGETPEEWTNRLKEILENNQ